MHVLQFSGSGTNRTCWLEVAREYKGHKKREGGPYCKDSCLVFSNELQQTKDQYIAGVTLPVLLCISWQTICTIHVHIRGNPTAFFDGILGHNSEKWQKFRAVLVMRKYAYGKGCASKKEITSGHMHEIVRRGTPDNSVVLCWYCQTQKKHSVTANHQLFTRWMLRTSSAGALSRRGVNPMLLTLFGIMWKSWKIFSSTQASISWMESRVRYGLD